MGIAKARSYMGVVFQEQILFNDSIRNNLKIGIKLDEEITSDKVLWDALGLANAQGFVKELPLGLDTIIGSNGVSLSGGQKQRIAIARVILSNPPLLLLDEATSALDSISEEAIKASLHELYKSRTSIVIAHRLSTILDLDRLILLDKGKIVEMGSHKELLEAKGKYAKLFKAQKKGFLNWKGDDE